MSLNIVFGSVKTTSNRSATIVQEFDYPSVKLEASRGPKTSRRVLFNREASNLLSMGDGAIQQMLFGFAEPEGDGPSRLFVINTEDYTNEVEQKTYKTSKNGAAYHDSKEKGKAISSTPLSNEIREFLGITDDTVDVNLSLSVYSTEGEATCYELHVGDAPQVETIADNDGSLDQPVENWETTDEANDEKAYEGANGIETEAEEVEAEPGFEIPS